MTFAVHRRLGSASEFHAQDLPPERAAWIFSVDAPAIVLGSTQPAVAVEGVALVRRRSGGGAVYLEPRTTLWVDVVVPRGDALWDDDVGRATHWLGACWARAIGGDATVHHGPMVHAPLSDVVCFAGLGPGEVTIDGRKAVGISQRRTRDAARFQCVAYEQWDPAPLVELLALDGAALAGVGVGVGSLTTLETAFLAELP